MNHYLTAYQDRTVVYQILMDNHTITATIDQNNLTLVIPNELLNTGEEQTITLARKDGITTISHNCGITDETFEQYRLTLMQQPQPQTDK